MTETVVRSLSEDAVLHARAASRAGDLAWAHLHSEYTQDIPKVLATLATDSPLTWTLPDETAQSGPLRYLSAVTIEEIRAEYEKMREFIEIWNFEAFNEIRNNWYIVTHGVVTTRRKDTGEESRGETVTMFPVGRDGILGEVQIGGIGTDREGRWPEVPARPGEVPEPKKRLQAWALHNQYIEDLKAENVAGLVGAHRSGTAATIRNYLTDDSSVLNATGGAELGAYFTELFGRYQVLDVRLVNRLVESWYVFADLHWTVQERGGGRRRLEFCTAETAPLDPDGKFWVRTGSGTDPVQLPE